MPSDHMDVAAAALFGLFNLTHVSAQITRVTSWTCGVFLCVENIWAFLPTCLCFMYAEERVSV